MRYTMSVCIGAWLGAAMNSFSLMTVMFAAGATLPSVALFLFTVKETSE